MNQLLKRSGETRTFQMDFSLQPEISGGASLTGTPTVVSNTITAGATALTLTSIGISGTKVQVTIAGGTTDALYQLVFTCSCSTGAILVGIGYLTIDD